MYRVGGMHLAFCLWKGSGGLGSLVGGGGSEVSGGGGGVVVRLCVWASEVIWDQTSTLASVRA